MSTKGMLPPVSLALHGTWSRRIFLTLRDADGPLNTRQLRIRCGVVTAKQHTAFHNALRRLALGRHILSWPSGSDWHINNEEIDVCVQEYRSIPLRLDSLHKELL